MSNTPSKLVVVRIKQNKEHCGWEKESSS